MVAVETYVMGGLERLNINVYDELPHISAVVSF